MEDGAPTTMTQEKRLAVVVVAPEDAAAAAAAPALLANGAAAEEHKAGEDPPAPPTALLSGWPRRTGLYLFVMNVRFVPFPIRPSFLLPCTVYSELKPVLLEHMCLIWVT